MTPFLISGQDLSRPVIRQVEGNSKTWSMDKSGHLLVLLQMSVNVNLFHASGFTIFFHGMYPPQVTLIEYRVALHLTITGEQLSQSRQIMHGATDG